MRPELGVGRKLLWTYAYIVVTSVVSMSVICEVDMLVAIVVTMLRVIVVEIVGNGGKGLDVSLWIASHQYAFRVTGYLVEQTLSG